MQLRSGRFLRGGLTDADIKSRTFRVTCMNFIGKLNDSTCSDNTLHILYRMYNYINNEIDNISSNLKSYNSIESFLLGVTKNIPKHIIDIVAYETTCNLDANWIESTGFSAIEIGRMMYELRLKLREVLVTNNERRR